MKNSNNLPWVIQLVWCRTRTPTMFIWLSTSSFNCYVVLSGRLANSTLWKLTLSENIQIPHPPRQDHPTRISLRCACGHRFYQRKAGQPWTVPITVMSASSLESLVFTTSVSFLLLSGEQSCLTALPTQWEVKWHQLQLSSTSYCGPGPGT